MSTTTEHTDGADLVGLLAGSLPNGLDPFPDESLAGFIMRMAENHGYATPLQLLQPLGQGLLTLRQAVRRFAECPGLAEYLGLRPEEIERLGPGRGQGWRVLGHELHNNLVVLGGRKVCPACIADEAYHRAHWDLTLMTVCPVHAVRMLSHCPECDGPLNWRSGPLTCCSAPSCGADLRWAETSSVPDAEMGGIRSLHRLLTTGHCEEFPAPVAELSVSDQIQLAFALGCVATGRQAIVRPQNLAKAHPDQVHLALAAGWRMCAGWPAAFSEGLDRRRADNSGSRGRYGIRKNFGTLWAWLERHDEPYAKLISTEFTDYLVSRPELATHLPAIQHARMAAPRTQQALSMTEARNMLGVGFEVIHRLAEQHDLYLVPPTGSGAPALLRAERVDALHRERSRLLTKADVRTLLGTGKATVDKLREAGLLPVVADGADPDGVRYPLAGVDDLLADLEGRVVPVSDKVDEPVTMATIARQVGRPDFDVCDVLGAVRAGKLTPRLVDTDARGLHRFLFAQAEVDRFVAEVTAVAGRTLTVVEAAEELGVKQEVAYYWARAGLLETVTVDTPGESGRRVTQAAIEAFRREYVTGVEYAERHGLDRRWAGHHIVMAGIQQVSGPTVDGARQILFRRADLKGFDPKLLVSGRSKLKLQAAHQRRLGRGGNGELQHVVGRALNRKFGEGLVRRYHQYRDGATGTLIQVVMASNQGTVGTYNFGVSATHCRELAVARRGFIAFAFADRPDFLLVPWVEAKSVLVGLRWDRTARGLVARLTIRAHASGLLDPFGGYALPLGEAVER